MLCHAVINGVGQRVWRTRMLLTQLFIIKCFDASSIHLCMVYNMLQAQHRGGASVHPGQSGRTTIGGGIVGTVGSRSSELMSKSTANRKALLGQSYYEDAKKYECYNGPIRFCD